MAARALTFFSSMTSLSRTSSVGGAFETEQATSVPPVLSKSSSTSALPGNHLSVESSPPKTHEAHSPEILVESQVRSFAFFKISFSKSEPRVPTLSTSKDRKKRERASDAFSKSTKVTSRSEKNAKNSALLLRSLIVGSVTTDSPKVTNAVSKPQLSKLKSTLMQPKAANEVIAQLRALPYVDMEHSTDGSSQAAGPIHAVCLEHIDADEDRLHFSKLTSALDKSVHGGQAFPFQTLVSVPVELLSSLFNEMHIVDLLKAPDLGLGQPGDGKGLLAGAVPTAETVINGVKKITPQLMALGFATGRAAIPDHSGIHPPVDRMSVLTYWWGLELLLPPPSLAYLRTQKSIPDTVVNFLSALALINEGVREILPFVRYIAQFVDFEFSSIQKQDKGRGVVCAATWIMPAAMVPRPWDFPDS